ncbi:MAG: phosphotransferase [Anaerolineales bacterium]
MSPDAASLLREWNALSEALSALPMDDGRLGLIHFDFDLDNLVWHAGGIGVLDFDDCARYWYAADIALALRDLFSGGVDLSHPSFRMFIEGYRSQNALEEAAIQQMPLFLRLSKLVQYGRMARALDMAEGGSYPDWLVGLEAKLRGRVEGYLMSLEA